MENRQETLVGGGKRSSNIELYRIFLMLGIIAHHLVVNSGLTQLYDFNNITFNMVFAQCFGMFGKIGINCFVLITGYFMINKNITLKKFLKLYLEYKFYTILFYLIFLITGYSEFNLKALIKVVFSTVYAAGSGFTGTYIFFFLLIPFLNVLIKNITKKQFELLLIILITYFTIISTFFLHNTWNYILWFCVIYFIGAYIKLYPIKFFEKQKLMIFLTITTFLIIFASIICIDYLGPIFGFYDAYHFVVDCHKVLALVLSILLFITFKNLKIKNLKIINIPASSTFGILLIHSISDDMRRLLWNDIFNIPKLYLSQYFPLYAFAITVSVYLVCFVLDQIRIYLIEKPLFKFLDKKFFKKTKSKDETQEQIISNEEKA